jgi:hypothetical protein
MGLVLPHKHTYKSKTPDMAMNRSPSSPFLAVSLLLQMSWVKRGTCTTVDMFKSGTASESPMLQFWNFANAEADEGLQTHKL